MTRITRVHRTTGTQTDEQAEEQTDELWDALVAGDERRAVGVVTRALDDGADPEAVLLDLIAAAQRRVGEAWAGALLTVAQEHAATAISDRAVAALALHPAVRHPGGSGRITVACVDGEWHALPARLLAEVLRLRGWQVDFLGAQVPSPHLISQLHRTGPDAVALSGSLVTRLPTAHTAISACQSAGVPVLVGGAAFGRDGRYARLLRADAWAPDARAAAELLARPLPVPGTPHPPADALPHLDDQEYTLVAGARSRLVRATIAGLTVRFPPLGEYDERQRRHTAEDIAHIVDHLACALYVADDALFTSFLGWTAGILTVRGVPSRALSLSLRVLLDELRDFPRATALLHAGLAALADREDREGRVDPADPRESPPGRPPAPSRGHTV
ncbi:B12-binding domain-containing protein [Streptomyces sp. NPDC127033]|uniref:cobalamin B12-binding domain-containing protein n=1 Tax=Streptomyces sp. NPDC127033 TaxID=3347110 RepID=UPI00365A75C5